MNSWSKVGGWLKENGSSGLALIGSIISGNVPAAIAAGASLISTATGTDDPAKALDELKTNPESMSKLKELYYQNENGIRKHHEYMLTIKLEDEQYAHSETQKTVRAGDVADDRFVRWTRPGQSWLSLSFAMTYVSIVDAPDIQIVIAFLALPYSYAGLRQLGKGIDSFTGGKLVTAKNKIANAIKDK